MMWPETSETSAKIKCISICNLHGKNKAKIYYKHDQSTNMNTLGTNMTDLCTNMAILVTNLTILVINMTILGTNNANLCTIMTILGKNMTTLDKTSVQPWPTLVQT